MAEPTDSIPTQLLEERAVVLDASAVDKESAIRRTGQVLVDIDAVDPRYIGAMLERERSVSTYMGSGVSIPHGTNESRQSVHRDALAFLRFPDGVDWNGQQATIAIGIAATGNNHVGILSRLAMILVDSEQVARLNAATNARQVIALLQPDSPAEGEER
jgi:PTS system mannitol-specific IIA component